MQTAVEASYLSSFPVLGYGVSFRQHYGFCLSQRTVE